MLQWSWLALEIAPEQLAVPAGQPQHARPAAPPPCAIKGKDLTHLVQDGPELALHPDVYELLVPEEQLACTPTTGHSMHATPRLQVRFTQERLESVIHPSLPTPP